MKRSKEEGVFLRGLGGRGGSRSIMTDRGGIGIAAKRRMTTNKTRQLI
jgi:hypothetical protein